MNDLSWLAPTIMAAGSFIGSAVAALIAWRGYKRGTVIASELIGVKTNVQKIELATNSMKDALILSTKKENLLIGHAEGVASEKAAQALRAEGAATGEK